MELLWISACEMTSCRQVEIFHEQSAHRVNIQQCPWRKLLQTCRIREDKSKNAPRLWSPEYWKLLLWRSPGCTHTTDPSRQAKHSTRGSFSTVDILTQEGRGVLNRIADWEDAWGMVVVQQELKLMSHIMKLWEEIEAFPTLTCQNVFHEKGLFHFTKPPPLLHITTHSLQHLRLLWPAG